MTQQELEAIKARCEATTPGPWEYDGMHNEIHAPQSDVYWLIVSELRSHPGETITDKFGHSFNANFNFIANARQDIPALLSEIDRLTQERDAAVNEAQKSICYTCKFYKPLPPASDPALLTGQIAPS